VALPVGLALALDPGEHSGGVFGQIGSLFETPSEKKRRLEVIGTPTVWGRADLAQHFILSAALSAMMGAQSAAQLGVAKELADSQGGSGFSLADLSADLAGIAFAEHLKTLNEAGASRLAEFKVDDFVPDPSGLAEGLSRAEFESRYGSASDARFRRLLTELRGQIQRLPPYKR
jgi:hypothetical protein